VRWIGVVHFTVDTINRCERIRHFDPVQHLCIVRQQLPRLLPFRIGTSQIERIDMLSSPP
jgi:hypothetical protein